jgi:pyrroline-5-carboxylate reductase
VSLLFIGGGNMAGALVGGLLGKGWPASAIAVVEIAEPTRLALGQRYGVTTHAALPPEIERETAVVLAVKPQHLGDAARALAPLLRGQLVITVAAGIRSGDLSRWLDGHERIVRVMPNTPALVMAGVSALYAAPGAHSEDRRRCEELLSAVGRTLWVQREELMDAVTAVSGSGPAYVFYFMEALMQAAAELGLSAEQARVLTLETFYGAACLARQSADAPAALRAQVTSKGGTTARALGVLEDNEVRVRIAEAVKQAAQRSRELGDELGSR